MPNGILFDNTDCFLLLGMFKQWHNKEMIVNILTDKDIFRQRDNLQ